MKGTGTFRRMLAAVVASVGMAPMVQSIKATPNVDPHQQSIEEGLELRRRPRRNRHAKRRSVMRVGWPLLYHGNPRFDCPKPLSRKALKRLAPFHPALGK